MSSTIPIFDSLAHPTIDGDWILPRYPQAANMNCLQEQMKQANVKWAFAVGMRNIGGYSNQRFIDFVKKNDTNAFLPVAFFHPPKKNVKEIQEEISSLKRMGYVGIKLHPRISNCNLSESISNVIKIANDFHLAVLLCTYNYSNTLANKITPESTMNMLTKISGSKLILVHGGGVRLLEYMEIARAFPNVLLDLSLTISKYEGSSIDNDLSFLFNHFDRRICIGSDFPEISLLRLRERFEAFSKSISLEKKENIAYKNIVQFCDIEI